MYFCDCIITADNHKDKSSSSSFERHPRCSAWASWHVERSLSQRKNLFELRALRATEEVCILPQPAQAVVQTRRLNEAWSWQLFWTDAARWVLLPPPYCPLSVTWAPAKQPPRVLLSFLKADTVCVYLIDESVLNYLHSHTHRSSEWMDECVLFEWCNHGIDQQKELLLDGNAVQLQVHAKRNPKLTQRKLSISQSWVIVVSN